MVDSLLADSLLINEETEEQESILQQIFGKKRQDTIHINDLNKPKIVSKDTLLTPAASRKEKREQRKLQRDSKNKNEND